MKKIPVFFALHLLFLICSHSFSQTIPVKINEYGLIFIDVTLNDSVKGRFIFDTGGGALVVSSKTYKRVESTLKNGGYYTGFRHDGGRFDLEVKLFPSVSVGNLRVTDVPGGIFPMLDDYEIDGIISIKQFEKQPVTIDFKNKTMTLETPQSMAEIEKTAERLPLIINDLLDLGIDVFVNICLNDSVKIRAEFDTGSGFNTLLVNPYFIPITIADTLSLKSNEYTNPLSGVKMTDKIGKINSVTYCGSSILSSNNNDVTFRQGLIYEGLIGSGMFKDKILTIDVPNKRLLVRK
jgi:hypothetical protein